MPTEDSWVAIHSAELSAAIDPLGAQLSLLRDAKGCDLLWNGDAAIWNGRAPVLFPLVGMLAGGQYRLGDRHYTMARHGFARRSLFTIASQSATSATFRLSETPDTLAIYPFRFELEVQFSIDSARLTIESRVRNTGEVLLPASLGYHPALRWPLYPEQPRSAYFIEFDQDEPEPLRQLDDNGLLKSERIATPVHNRRLDLRDALFTHDALIFDRIRSRSVRYGAAGGSRIEVSYPHMPYLGIWTKPGAGFICIEPWAGISDEAGYDGDLYGRVGSFSVPPGDTHTLGMSISVLNSAGR